MSTERLLVLASSKKLAARCIAGISLESGRWVRPVSSPSGGALTVDYCGVYGRYPRALEVVRLDTIEACPLPHQPENMLVPRGQWTLEPPLKLAETERLLEENLDIGPTLLGSNGRTLDEQICRSAPVGASLTIIEPRDLCFENEAVQWGDGSRQWARFQIGGQPHALTISDFMVRPRLKQKPFGTYKREELDVDPIRFITVSLGDAFKGVHYKLAAAVFGLR